jgi:hypothetical protein
MDADRTRVMAYRLLAQQLQRVDEPPHALAVLDLGVQDTPYGVARQALAARTTVQKQSRDLRMAWTHRGAPHLHRTADLTALMPALWPFSDADAVSRLGAGPIKEAAKLGLAAFEQTARAFRKAVRKPMPKGEVSTAVSALVDRALTYDCRSCAARHISGGLFQSAGLAGGVGLRVEGAQAVIEPLADRGKLPTKAAGVEAVVLTYLRLLGPATAGEVAKFIGTTQTHLRPFWPADDLVEIRVDGRKTYLPEDSVEAFEAAETPGVVRLLPPSDPLLQARDRNLLVPEKAHQAEVWRILGNPGALLVDGEIAGTWRAKASGKRELAVTVTPFGKLSKKARAEVEAEAAVVAGVRGIAGAAVTFGD